MKIIKSLKQPPCPFSTFPHMTESLPLLHKENGGITQDAVFIPVQGVCTNHNNYVLSSIILITERF